MRQTIKIPYRSTTNIHYSAIAKIVDVEVMIMTTAGLAVIEVPGPRFNIKMSANLYGKSHCGDKTVVISSYLHNGISYTGKMSSLY